MGQFDNSLNKAKELIKFENERIDKVYSSIEKDQWEFKAIATIEAIGDEWNKFIGACPKEELKLKLEFLTIQALGFVIRDREKLIRKPAPLAFWNQITQQLQEFTQKKGLFPFGTSLKILENASLALEQKIPQTEWIIQTPKRWNLKWDTKENLDIKVDFLNREIQDYQSKLDKALENFTLNKTPLGEDPFIWPRDLNAVILLLKIASIRKPKSPCIDLPDSRLTATLITDPGSCVSVLKHQLTTAEKGVEELRKKNKNFRQTIQRAHLMAEAGDHLKAGEVLKTIPPHFRLNEQREVLELISKVNQRLTQIQAVLTKLQEMDLQKLDWSAIEEFCDEIRETIQNDPSSRSDYEVEANRLLLQIEGYVKKHRNALILKSLSILSIIALIFVLFYFLRPSHQTLLSNQLEIKTVNSEVTWSLFKDNGTLLKEGAGNAKVDAPDQTLFLTFRQGNRIALERILWNGKSLYTVSQNKSYANPFVRIQAYDSTGVNALDPENYQLQVDRIPIPSNIEGIHLVKGVHRFSITQQGQPEFDLPQMISQRNETVTLSSPWVAINFNANADDLFVSINNSSKRLIPYRFFLPVGSHEAIFSDSRGDIRESRRIQVQGGTEVTENLGVATGKINIVVTPVRSGLKLLINDISHTLNQGKRDLTLSTGEQRIQLFLKGKLSYEANLVLRADEEIDRTINLTPAP